MTAKRKNAGAGALFNFHGSFTKKAAAVKKEQTTPGGFIRPVYYKHGMRYAVLSAKQNPKAAVKTARKAAKKQVRRAPLSRRMTSTKTMKVSRAQYDRWAQIGAHVMGEHAAPRSNPKRKKPFNVYRAYVEGKFYEVQAATIAQARQRIKSQIAFSSPEHQKSIGKYYRPIPEFEVEQVTVRNPRSSLAGAARVHDRFIGKRATKVTRQKTSHPAAARARGQKLPVARMATVSYLKVRNPHLKNGLIRFPSGKRPRLLAHASGRQYYLEGGNQNLQGVPGVGSNPEAVTPAMLRRAGLDNYTGTLIPLGEVQELGYFERKAVEDFRPVEYYHHLGEENGKRPVLVYAPKERQMHLVGGDYRTLRNGINN